MGNIKDKSTVKGVNIIQFLVSFYRSNTTFLRLTLLSNIFTEKASTLLNQLLIIY